MPGTPASAGELPRIAVVIIGRNEIAQLGACIRSVQAMRYPPELVELLYVDSDSHDGSPELAASLGTRVLRLTGAPMTAARGRNAGWRAADAPIVLFLDGDVELDPEFVARSIGHFADASVVSVWGSLRERTPEASIYNRVFDLDWVFPTGFVEFFGGIALVRRDGLTTVGGFNEELGAGEEPELSRRLRGQGWRILHTDDPMGLHDLAMTRWSLYWTRLVRSGRAYAQVSGMYAATADPMWLDVSRRNLQRGTFWFLLPVAALALSAASRSLWPVVGVGSLASLAALSTAWKARKRSGSLLTLLLFGIHSHFQELPILLGQVRYWRTLRGKGLRTLKSA